MHMYLQEKSKESSDIVRKPQNLKQSTSFFETTKVQ